METKQIIDEIRSNFEQFKIENDARLAEVEKFGKATAETNAKVEAINSNISGLQNQLREIETRLNRPRAGGFGGSQASDEQLRVYARWQSVAQGREVDPGQVDLDLIENYGRAFRSFLRRGDDASAQILNQMSVASDPDGGFLVSPDTGGRIVEFVRETSLIRQVAAVQTISTDALEGINDLDDAAAAWVGETQARPQTATPQVGVWRIPIHEQYAEPRATQKLLDDAQIDIEGWLAGKVASRFARAENTAFVSGDGVLRPRGFLTYAAGVPTPANWQQIEQVVTGDANLLTANGTIDLVYSLKSEYRQGSVFGMNRLAESQIRQLLDGSGRYIWQPDFTRLGAATLLGFPIVEMADMPIVAAGNLPVVFGNFREGYQIVDRIGIRVLRDPYTTKPFVKFYTTKRVGGGVLNFEALKIQIVGV